ncbi:MULTISPECIES: hypothetical protein [unclassified Mesorhizobium]|uniref:hypothetical protein n=1 Tax=unclassified Mesorhizobium TaxID=325217 RepID=UPI001CCAE3C7|nr:MULTISPECIES: hypothetical protein [unclassified Mesorhizobium]MBZ9743431.1 hypothetical protein [Mesorhizobium sp. CO1-1-4]MBZ9805446.1 hypothetical protein [Mesorhizobium sp. ES1-6]
MRTMARSSTAGANVQIANNGAVDAKSLVLASIGELVDGGKAEWSGTATGEIELRLLSGEVFLLGEVTVTRVV